MKMPGWVASVLMLFCAAAHGTITVSISPSAGSTGAGTYASGSSIAITTNFSGSGHSFVSVTIQGLTTDSIGALTINATSSIPVEVIARSGTIDRLASIGRIDTPPNTALVRLRYGLPWHSRAAVRWPLRMPTHTASHPEPRAA